jgi:hypothetical protein
MQISPKHANTVSGVSGLCTYEATIRENITVSDGSRRITDEQLIDLPNALALRRYTEQPGG